MRLRDLYRDRVVWLFAAAVVALFWRPLTVDTFYFRDLYHLFYPKKLFFVDAIRDGILPLWDPFTNGGRPYLATPSNYAFHPSNVLYLILPTLLAFNLVLVLHVFFCAVAAYWLARLLGLSEWSAAIAGAVFAFCGYTLSTANLTPLLLGLPWIPMTLGLAHRRSLIAASIAAAMPLYGAAAELTAMLFVTLIVLECGGKAAAFARALVRRDRTNESGDLVAALQKVGFIIVFAIALSLLQTLPAISVIEQSARAEKRDYAVFTQWSVAPQRLPELVVPRFFGDTDSLREEAYWGRNYETLGYPYILSLYFGIPALALACIGARRAPHLALLAAAGIVLSLGSNLPGFRLIYDHVPFVGIFRYPVKAQLLALLPIALLAAHGAEIVHGRRWWTLILATIAAALSFQHPVFVHAAIAAAAFALVPRGPWLAAVVMLDLAIAGYTVNDFAPRVIYEEPPIAGVVRDVAGPGRFYAAERNTVISAPSDDLMWLPRWQMATLEGYTAATFGIRVVYHGDYDGLAARRMATLGGIIEKLPWERRKLLLDRAAVRAFIAPEVVPGFREMAQLHTPSGPLRLYANPGAPPARFASSADFVGTETDALRRVVSTNRLVLEERVPLGNCGNAEVRLVDGRYLVDAPCRGMVVFAEPHYDGWTTTVDGKDVDHVRADYAFTAVPVERGRHVIERHYRPPLLFAGLLASIAAAGLLVLMGRRFTS